MEDNPVYNQVSPAHSPQPPQQENSMSNSSSPNTHDTNAGSSEPTSSVVPNPVYGVSQISSSSGSPRPHRSTIRHVQNPVYGDSSDRNTVGNVYSTPHLSTQKNNDDCRQPEYSYAIVDAATSNVATQQVGGTLQSTETVVEHEYAMVDKSAKITSSVPVGPHNHAVPPYDQLRHEQCTSNGGKSQTTTNIRLAEEKDLGYSVLT